MANCELMTFVNNTTTIIITIALTAKLYDESHGYFEKMNAFNLFKSLIKMATNNKAIDRCRGTYSATGSKTTMNDIQNDKTKNGPKTIFFFLVDLTLKGNNTVFCVKS